MAPSPRVSMHTHGPPNQKQSLIPSVGPSALAKAARGLALSTSQEQRDTHHECAGGRTDVFCNISTGEEGGLCVTSWGRPGLPLLHALHTHPGLTPPLDTGDTQETPSRLPPAWELDFVKSDTLLELSELRWKVCLHSFTKQ